LEEAEAVAAAAAAAVVAAVAAAVLAGEGATGDRKASCRDRVCYGV
jgi:2-methylcitrate dehydratase PrpD